MGDLEDRILKMNVPGARASRWDDNSDTRDFVDDLDSYELAFKQEREEAEALSYDEAALVNEAKYMVESEVPEPIRQRILAERLGKANTGVYV